MSGRCRKVGLQHRGARVAQQSVKLLTLTGGAQLMPRPVHVVHIPESVVLHNHRRRIQRSRAIRVIYERRSDPLMGARVAGMTSDFPTYWLTLIRRKCSDEADTAVLSVTVTVSVPSPLSFTVCTV